MDLQYPSPTPGEFTSKYYRRVTPHSTSQVPLTAGIQILDYGVSAGQPLGLLVNNTILQIENRRNMFFVLLALFASWVKTHGGWIGLLCLDGKPVMFCNVSERPLNLRLEPATGNVGAGGGVVGTIGGGTGIQAA